MKALLTLIILACLLTSCNHSLSGRYKITAFGNCVGNDTVVTYLRKTLVSKQFDLAVDSNVVTMRSLETHYQFILKRWKDAKLLTYLSRFNDGAGEYSTILKRDTGFVMDVTLDIPDNMVLPIQNGGFNITDLAKGRHSKSGRVSCYLNKVSD